MSTQIYNERQSQPFNVVGLFGFLSGIVAYIFIFIIPMFAMLFWLGGHILSLIGLFRPKRACAVLGYILSMIPLVMISFFGMVNMSLSSLHNDSVFDQEPSFEALEPDSTVESESKDMIEIKSPRGGYVNVYIGMPKDEVKAVLGRPDKVDVNTFLGAVSETWQYDMPNYSRMTIEFRDGKLEIINQY